MNTTNNQGNSSGLPVKRKSAKATAYQRSPTLLRGGSPDSQGDVKVWIPDPKQVSISPLGAVYTAAFMLSAILAWAIAMAVLQPGSVGPLWATFIVIVIMALVHVPLHRYKWFCRTSYIVTDQLGIAVTTSRGTRSLYWREIQSLEGWWFTNQMRLEAPDPIIVSMTGYSESVQQELITLIKGRAELTGHLTRPSLFVRSNAALSSPDDPAPSPLEPGRNQ